MTDKPDPARKAAEQEAEIKAMTRAEASEAVKPHLEIIRGMACVPKDRARELLGETRYHRMLRDPMRHFGESAENVYNWNVVDYLVAPDLRADKDPRPLRKSDGERIEELEQQLAAAERATLAKVVAWLRAKCETLNPAFYPERIVLSNAADELETKGLG